MHDPTTPAPHLPDYPTEPGSPELKTREDSAGPLVYTPAQAAQIVATTEAWLRRKAGQGRIPCTRIGKRVGFTREDLVAIVEAARRSASTRHHAAQRVRRSASRPGSQR